MAAPNNYISTTETVLTAGMQAVVAGGLGTLLDNSFPPMDDGKSDLQVRRTKESVR